MEKLESKLRHMEYFVMKSQNTTIEEKLELLEAIGEMKKKVQKIKERKEVTNVDENVEISDKGSDDTTNDIGRVEEHTEERKIKLK